MNRWIAALAAVTIVVAGGLWYTTRQVGSPPEPPKPVVRDSVVIGMALEPPGLDPTIAPAAAIGEITHLNIFEGLTKIRENGEVAPLLAQSWTVSPDMKTRSEEHTSELQSLMRISYAVYGLHTYKKHSYQHSTNNNSHTQTNS